MGMQTASTLYPRNDTTVDTGTGIDIRLLGSSAGATDETTSVRWTHTQDNTERVFDPATALVTTVANADTFQGEGWALRLTDDMTPSDDTNCNAALTPGALSVSLDARLNMNGGTNLGGPSLMTFRTSLWRYNPATNTGTLIATGTGSETWTTSALGGENNIYKTVTSTVVVSSLVEFAQGEILLLQVGCLGGTFSNAVLGTTNFDLNLRLASVTRAEYAAGQKLTSLCAFTGAATGTGDAAGQASRVLGTQGTATGIGDAAGAMSARADATGTATGASDATGLASSVAGTTGSASGAGAATGVMGATGSMTGASTGTSAATGALGSTGAMTGAAGGTSGATGILGATGGMTGTASGTGSAQGLASSVAGTTGTAEGTGTANGLASIVLGAVGAVTIGEPASETPDWPVVSPTRQVAGTVIHHETAALIEGAMVRLYRDMDKLLVQTATTGVDGSYAFLRDADDPYAYFATANYDDAGTPIQGMTANAAPTLI